MAEDNAEKSDAGEDSEVSTPASAPAPSGNTASRTGMFLVVLFGFAIMVSTPLITYFVVKSTVTQPKMELPEKTEDIKEKPMRPTAETTVDIDPVVVNIDGTQGTRYLKLEVQLVASEAALAEKLRDASLKAMVKDRIITSAGNKTITDLEGERGRENVRREIIQRLNNEFGGEMNGVVVDVYYKDYLIQ